MKLGTILVLLLAIPCTAQVKIKGHQIGESAADFLGAETAMRNQVADCHAHPPRAISVDEVKQRSFPDGVTKRDYLNMARQGRLFDQNVDAYNKRCEPLFNIFDKAGNGSLSTSFLPRPDADPMQTMTASWTFESGKVVELSMFVFGTYDEVREDLAAKARMRPEETSVPFQNGFGAKWVTRRAEWKTDELYISLLESNNPAENMRLPFLSIKTRALYDAEQKAGAAHGSPLD